MLNNSKKFLISGFLLMFISLISVLIFKLNLSIDFTGGVLAEYQYQNQNQRDIARDNLQRDFEIIFVQKTNNNSLIIKLSESNLKATREKLLKSLEIKVGEEVIIPKEIRFQNLSPSFSSELLKKSIIAILISFIFMIIFISMVFSSATTKYIKSYHYGIAALIALLHDFIIPLGIFSFLSNFFLDYEVNSFFIAALLAVIGFSINDTIVVFDRIRENIKDKTLEERENFPQIVEKSIKQSFRRSLLTSITSLVVLLILFFTLTAAIKSFLLILILGIIFGTFSSLFFAPFILLLFQKKSIK